MAIVDGYTGTLYIDPEPELLKEYEIRHAADKEEREELLRLRNQKDITVDGKEIKLLANIGNSGRPEYGCFITERQVSAFSEVNSSISEERIIQERMSCSVPIKNVAEGI
mgnify:CR=1 FL=1